MVADQKNVDFLSLRNLLCVYTRIQHKQLKRGLPTAARA